MLKVTWGPGGSCCFCRCALSGVSGRSSEAGAPQLPRGQTAQRLVPSPYVAVTLRNSVISMLPMSPGVRYLLRGTERKWPSQVLESGPHLGFVSWQHWRAREALQTHPSLPGRGSSREGLCLPGCRAGLWWLQLRCVFSAVFCPRGWSWSWSGLVIPDAQSSPPAFDVINILFHY